jgi:hypothetical protein
METHSSPSKMSDSTKRGAERPTFDFLENGTLLQGFVETWKAGKLPKAEWTHAAHVAVAAYFAFDHAAEATFAIMKTGILHHNMSVGTPNTEDNGYHETLTRFWSSEIGEFVRANRFASRLDAVRAAVSDFGTNRDRFRQFYSFDVVRDRRARREWVPPDRKTAAK